MYICVCVFICVLVSVYNTFGGLPSWARNLRSSLVK